MDSAVFARCKGCLPEFDETVLAGKTLPTFGNNPRWIDSSSGPASGIAGRTICRRTIPRARYSQHRGHGDLFDSVRHHATNVGGSPARCAVGRPARVVNDVGSRVLVA